MYTLYKRLTELNVVGADWIHDVAAHPAIRKILHRQHSSDCTCFAGDQVSEALQQAMAARNSLLKAALRSQGQPTVGEPYELARASVTCTFCTAVLRGRRLLAHRCREDYTIAYRPTDDAVDRALYKKYGLPWTMDSFDVENSLERMDWLLRALGRDPCTQIYKDMWNAEIVVTYVGRASGETTVVVGPTQYHVVVSHVSREYALKYADILDRPNSTFLNTVLTRSKNGI